MKEAFRFQQGGRHGRRLGVKTAEFVLYPGAPHALYADYRSSYRAEPAKDAWAASELLILGHALIQFVRFRQGTQ